MKTMCSKHRFLAALSVVLLISAALVTSCMDLLDGYQVKQELNKKAPAGKGLVILNVTDSNARTILPDLPAVESMYYSVEFTATDDPTSNNHIIGDTSAVAYNALNNVPTSLAPDTYTIVITAWDVAAKTNALAGWTSSAGVVVNTGATATVDANLKGWTTSGTGAFTYNITVPPLPTGWAVTTVPTSYSTAEMVITAPASQTINLTAGTNSGSVSSLTAGYYTVTITLKAANCQDRVVKSAMHIYNTMESTWTYSVPALSQDKFSVAFNMNGITNTGTAITTQSNIANAGTVTDPGNPSNAGYTFEGWFTAGSGGGAVSGTEWVFGSSGTQIFKDTTLYAKWTAIPDTPITIAAIPGVTAPVAGVAPVAAITDTAQYTGTVSWNGNPATFAASTAYTATITLSPKTGYTLTGVAEDFFTVAGATTVTNSADSGVVTAVFPATDATITIAAIEGVTAPVAGATPVTAITETAQYTGTVTWDNGNPATFAPLTAYTATITLTPKTGFTLYGVAANFFTVAGASPVTNTANTGTVTAVFPATGPVGINATITFDLTDVAISRGGTADDPFTYGDILTGGKTLTFTLDDSAVSVVTWDMDGTPLGSGATLTINSTSTFLSILTTGDHVINVHGTKDSQPYSANFTITVDNN